MSEHKLLGDLSVGEVVKIKENGVFQNFIIFRKGSFENGDYNVSDNDSVWLLREKSYCNAQIDSDYDCRYYQHSDIHNWLNLNYLNTLDEEISEYIKNVNINFTQKWNVYKRNERVDNTFRFGSGYKFETKVFLITENEISSNISVCKDNDGNAVSWWLRNFGGYVSGWNGSSSYHITYHGMIVKEDGTIGNCFNNYSDTWLYNEHGVRPAFVLPSSLLVDSENVVTTGVVNLPVPYLENANVDYNGLEQHIDTLGDNGNLKNFNPLYMDKTGDLSGTIACSQGTNYKITVSLKPSTDFAYQWIDKNGNTFTDDIELEWKILPIKIKKPEVWIETANDDGTKKRTQYIEGEDFSFDYSGYAPSYSDCWKTPVAADGTSIQNECYVGNQKYANVLTMTGDGLSRQYAYKNGGYSITFSIKDAESCSWEMDGEELDTDDYVVTWNINKIKVPIPVKETEEDFTYDANYYGIKDSGYSGARGFVVNNYNNKIMTYNNGYNSAYAYNAGTYTITYSLRDTGSCSWEDDSTTPKTINWKIKKQKQYMKPPEFLDGKQDKFDYDGALHAPVLQLHYDTYQNGSFKSGNDSARISITGTVSAVAANKLDDEDHKVNIISVKLKTVDNFEYFWEVDESVTDEEERARLERKDYKLLWVVNRKGFKIPTVSKEHRPFNGLYQYENPTLELGYNSNVMTYTGTTSASPANENGYEIHYNLRDNESAYWLPADGGEIDETDTGKKTVKWWIDKISVNVPDVTDTELPVKWYVNNRNLYVNNQSPSVDEFDTNIIRMSGNTGAHPNDYTLKLEIIDPNSSYWADGDTNAAKEFSWKILKEEMRLEKPYLDPVFCEFDYDGTQKTAVIKNFLVNYTNSGGYTYSYESKDNYSIRNTKRYKYGENFATKANKDGENYTITVELCEHDIFDLVWDDDTTDPVVLTWHINKSAFPKPDLESRAFKFTNQTIAVKELNYDSNIMTRSNDSTLLATSADDYFVTYSLKDKESASWLNEDGTETDDDVTVRWKIIALTGDEDAIDVPEVSGLEFTYNGDWHSPTITPSDYNTNLIGVRGTTSATNAGKYSFAFYLKAPSSSTWKDGSIEDKRFDWVINKAVERFDKPVLTTSPYEINYDGSEHTAPISGVVNYAMNVVNKPVAQAGEHSAVVSLKTNNKNYEYKWSDDTAGDVELKWTIKKIKADIPYIEESLFKYGAYASGYHYISYQWRQPEVFNFNPQIMNESGITNEKAKITNEYYSGTSTTIYPGRYWGDYQWVLGKYYIIITPKHPDSIEWVDENGNVSNLDKINIEWSIQREVMLLPKPYLNADNQVFEYSGLDITPFIENGDNAGVVKTGDITGKKAKPYTITCEPYQPQNVKDIYDYRWEDNTLDPIDLSWRITSGIAAIPALSETIFPYDGEPHKPAIENVETDSKGKPSKITYTGYVEKTKAGEYEIVFTLKDADSCTWSDGTVKPVTKKWHITKSTFEKPTISPEFLQYDYLPHKVLFGEEAPDDVENEERGKSFFVVGFKDKVMNSGGDTEKTDAGKYKAVVSLKDTDSASWPDGTTTPVELPWEIRKLTVLMDKPHLEPTEYWFDGDPKTPSIVYTELASKWKDRGTYIKDGSVRTAIYHGDYAITICLVENDKNVAYLWGDAIENAVGGEVSLHWKIKKATGEHGVEKPLVSDPVVSNLEYPYDKAEHEPVITNFNEKLVKIKDGSTVKATLNGDYYITFQLKYPNDSTWKDGSTADFTYNWKIVKPKQTLTKEQMPYLEPGKIPFDGEFHKPDVKNLGDVLEVKSNNRQKDTGTYEVVVGFKGSENDRLIDYYFPDGTKNDIKLSWEISPKTDITIPNIAPKSFDYDGTLKTPETVDFDEKFVIYDGEKSATTAGTKDVVFKLRYPNDTTWADGTKNDIELSWEILPFKFDKPAAAPLEFDYNGFKQHPVITGYDPFVMEQIGVIEETNAGNYKITYRLRHKDSASWKTYDENDTEDVVFEWKINKIGLDKPYLVENKFVYNGGTHKPTVKGIKERMQKSGDESGINIGDYHIYIYLKDPVNYKWNGEPEEKESARLDLPWFITKIPVDKPRVEPTDYPFTGKQINAVVKSFRASSMYYLANSQRSGTLVDTYHIFIGLNENYMWRDESEGDLDLEWHITKVKVTPPVVTDLKFTYDGAEHAPHISEYDVTKINRYGSIKGTNADTYTIRFELKDKEHNEWSTGGSEDIVYTWYIHKKVLKRPVAVKTHFVYNGGWHLPVIENIDERYMYFGGTNKETDAGDYVYNIFLKDERNFEYEDGKSDVTNISWAIGRKPIKMPYLNPNEFQYNGEYHSPEVVGFIADIMEITPYSFSTTSAKEVGGYRIFITLGKRKYYEDGKGYRYLRNWEWDGTDNYNDIVLNWRVVPKKIPYPKLKQDTFEYRERGYNILASEYIEGYLPNAMGTVGDTSALNRGDYSVGFYLTNTSNYQWEYGVQERKMIPWHIVRAKLPEELPKQAPVLIFSGYNQTPTWDSIYSSSKYVVTVEPKRNAGEYTADFEPHDNYTWSDGTHTAKKVEWEIVKAEIPDPEQIDIPCYNGEKQTPVWDFERSVHLSAPANMRKAVRTPAYDNIYNINFSGETEGTNADKYYVECECDDNVYFASTGTNKCNADWKILKKVLKLPETPVPYPYTGEKITAEFKGYDPDVMTISGETSGIDVDDYTAYFEIKDKRNYKWADDVVVHPVTKKAAFTWKIKASAVTAQIPYQNNWLIYNGEKQSPSFANYNTSLMTLLGGVPSKVNAGTYKVTFSLKPNVVWSDGITGDKTVEWEIDKKKYPRPYIKTSEATGGMYYYELEGKRYPIWENYVPEIMTMSGDTYDIDNSWHTTYFNFKDPDNYAWEDGRSNTYSVRWKLSEPYDPTRVPNTNDKKVHIPRQIKLEYEDGSTKYPVWDKFDTTAIKKIGGVWEGVSAGTYYVILELRDGYVWEDGTYEIKKVPWKILGVGDSDTGGDKLPIRVPHQINIPKYDGKVKEPEWDNWDDFGFDVVKGDLYGVLAGGYPVTLRLKTGYAWEDGTTDEKAVTWYIDKGETTKIPDEPVTKDPAPEKDNEEKGGCCCCNPCCCDSGLFDMLNQKEDCELTYSHNVKVNVSGVNVAARGTDKNDTQWLVIADSGDFSLDHDVKATIWLSGGGCNGEPAVGSGNNWESGFGGDGGSACKIGEFNIAKGQILTSVVAEVGDKTGTTLTIDGNTYTCTDNGDTSTTGGTNETLTLDGTEKNNKEKQAKVVKYGTREGTSGIETPYGWIGSSGGGGLICANVGRVEHAEGGQGAGDGNGHTSPGTAAANYGCGGGGGSVCIPRCNKGGNGKKGCIVISYVAKQNFCNEGAEDT